jgi:hypothetical protein
MPRLNLSDLPPNPPPYDGKNKLLVLAFPMSRGHIGWWAEKHNIQHELNSPLYTQRNRRNDAIHRIYLLLPRQWEIDAVRLEDGGSSLAWSFITNKEDDLKLANDLKSIEKVRKFLGARGPPQWYEQID